MRRAQWRVLATCWAEAPAPSMKVVQGRHAEEAGEPDFRDLDARAATTHLATADRHPHRLGRERTA